MALALTVYAWNLENEHVMQNVATACDSRIQDVPLDRKVMTYPEGMMSLSGNKWARTSRTRNAVPGGAVNTGCHGIWPGPAFAKSVVNTVGRSGVDGMCVLLPFAAPANLSCPSRRTHREGRRSDRISVRPNKIRAGSDSADKESFPLAIASFNVISLYSSIARTSCQRSHWGPSKRRSPFRPSSEVPHRLAIWANGPPHVFLARCRQRPRSPGSRSKARMT